MKLQEFLKNKVILLFIIFIIVYIIFFFSFKQHSDIWWDSASYIGAGKYIFSYGEEGVFEPQKSILLPIILGVLWKLNFNVILVGKIFIFLISLLSLVFLYLFSKELFNEKTAFLATLILSFNVLFFIFIFRLYTEMLSICFILGSIFFMLKSTKNKSYNYLFLSSLFAFLAFLSKYQNIILFGILNIYLIYETYKSKKVSSIILFNIFSFIIFLPFLHINYLVYGNPFYLVEQSKSYFKENLGTLYNLKAFPGIPRVLFKTTDLIYFKTILFLFNVLIPFIFYGLY